MRKTEIKWLLAVHVLLYGAWAHAVDFGHIAKGQQLPDNTLKIGRFHLELPDGPWTVVSKVSSQSGTQTGSSAVPTQLTLALARTRGTTVSAVLFLRTPANTFQSVNKWLDDPCAGIQKALVKDTMRQTFAMPECFAITTYAPEAFTSATTGPLADVATWVTKSGFSFPTSFLRVYYTKYKGGDFLHANMYLEGTAENLPLVNPWGREVARSLQKMVTRDSPVGRFPALPEPTAQKEPGVIGPSPVTSTQGAPDGKAEARLLQLKSLLEKGLISAEEFNDKRKTILQEM